MAARARVVVSAYEKLPLLRLAMRGWLRQTTFDFAMSIADDGSGPEIGAFVRAFAKAAPFAVDHVWWPHDGFRKAAIANEAMRRSAGEPLLVFTDGDCVPPPTFVERHLAAHGPRSFAVGGCYRARQEETERLTEADVDAGRCDALFRSSRRRKNDRLRWMTTIGTLLRLPRHPFVVGLNIAADRALVEELNGFDEAFVGYGHEDDDIRDRLMAARPRPRVHVLYGRNDVVHLWHPRAESWAALPNAAYYATKRPARCVRGLVPPAS